MRFFKKLLRRKRRGGITARWIVGSLLWTVLILTVGAMVIIYSLRESFYNYVKLSLFHNIEQVYTNISESAETGREQTVRMLIQEFKDRDRFELMAVDSEGKVLLTSSGFMYEQEEKLEDFFEAKSSPDRSSSIIGFASGGEHIISHSIVFAAPINNQIAGIRMVTSLRLVDNRITEILYTLIIICVLILSFSIFSGVFFIRSIVLPIRSIGSLAKRISEGDYSVRIDNRYADEIGDLCDIINDMAKNLYDIDRIKNDFISSVSHELRTPLTAIRGWGETITAAGRDETETFKKGMQIITGETDRLSLMVEDLLDFSRLQTGNIKINREPIDIIAELSEAVMTFENRAKGLWIELIYTEPSESAPVYGDKNRLRQVFSNLLENAIKYTHRGGSIRVDVKKDMKSIHISFSDTGIGIPEDDIEFVTEKYFRARNAVPGSGIGLALVQEIVSLHDGELHIESKLNEGTTVNISLPLLDQ